MTTHASLLAASFGSASGDAHGTTAAVARETADPRTRVLDDLGLTQERLMGLMGAGP